MRCTTDILTPVTRAHCFADFCGGRVNSSSTIVEEDGNWLLYKTSKIFAYMNHALNHQPQFYHECVEVLIMLEVPLQIHTITVFVLDLRFSQL